MTSLLTFVLYAPMAAFGGVAVGERRLGWDRPGRSAVLGLVGAALGIDRADCPAQQALGSSYGLAVRTDARGRALVDYHTVQVPPARRGRIWATRADELGEATLETVLTRRDYRTDALHLVALWTRDRAPTPLAPVATALARPRFTLFVGRKSCPLGLPLAPMLAEAPDVVTAIELRAAAAAEPEQAVRRAIQAAPCAVALDTDGMPAGEKLHRMERRRDQVASRARWQFDLREEAVLRPRQS